MRQRSREIGSGVTAIVASAANTSGFVAVS